jgi:flagellar biosynthesis repressor protein FlbT
MSLKLVLKPDEKIIINQAVIINGKSKTEITIENKSTILRKKDLLSEDEANSPAKLIYFLIQLIYIFPDQTEQSIPKLHELIAQYLNAAPSAGEIIATIFKELDQANYYLALKKCKKLINHERIRLDAIS